MLQGVIKGMVLTLKRCWNMIPRGTGGPTWVSSLPPGGTTPWASYPRRLPTTASDNVPLWFHNWFRFLNFWYTKLEAIPIINCYLFIYFYFYVNFRKNIGSNESHVLSTLDTTCLYTLTLSCSSWFNILWIFTFNLIVSSVMIYSFR